MKNFVFLFVFLNKTKPTEQHSLYIKLLSKQLLHQRQGFSLFNKTKDYLF
jgi:hypothetical protein